MASIPRKVCTDCGEEKSVREFKKRGGPYKNLPAADLNRYVPACKQCDKVVSFKTLTDPNYVPPRRRTPRELAKARAKKDRKNKHRRALTRKDLVCRTRIRSLTYLAERGCQECGTRDPRVLQYDHIDPSLKYKAVSRLISDGYSWSSPILRAEIKKCRIMCANCHQIHTNKQQGHYMDPQVSQALSDLLERYAA